MKAVLLYEKQAQGETEV